MLLVNLNMRYGFDTNDDGLSFYSTAAGWLSREISVAFD